MQEKQVTIGKETFKLPPPFFVMANNNPIESSGVYDLPEAQIDRFLFKLFIGYPKREEEKNIMEHNVTLKNFEDYDIRAKQKRLEFVWRPSPSLGDKVDMFTHVLYGNFDCVVWEKNLKRIYFFLNLNFGNN